MPPPEVLAQMQPAEQAPPGMGGALAPPQAGPPGDPDMLMIEGLMSDIARDVPALAPDVDLLLTKLKASMPANLPAPPGPQGELPPEPVGLPSPEAGGLTGEAPPGPSPVPFGADQRPGPGALPGPQSAAPEGPGGPLGMGSAVMGPEQVPNASPQPAGGVLQKAVQLELKLTRLVGKNPDIAPDIQYFIVRLREQVPKVHESAIPRRIPVADRPTERSTGLAVAV